MNRIFREETILSGVILLMAAIAPSLFPAALAGVEKLDVTGKYLLIPSIIILFATLFFASARGHRRLSNRVWAGILAGFAGTLGLEVVRATSFRLGGMPGDMPRLLGVLLTDRFMYGPSMFSDILGWSYHFWNGISFAIIFAVLFGRPRMIGALIYAQVIGLGLLLGPVVKSFGIGFMGKDMPAMPLTVVLAHLVFGILMGLVIRRRVVDEGWLLSD